MKVSAGTAVKGRGASCLPPRGSTASRGGASCRTTGEDEGSCPQDGPSGEIGSADRVEGRREGTARG